LYPHPFKDAAPDSFLHSNQEVEVLIPDAPDLTSAPCKNLNSQQDGSHTKESKWKLRVSIGICLLAVLAEVIGGILSGSLALLTDAAHLLSDLAGYGIGLFALWAVSLESTSEHSFGFHRAEMLGALLSILVIWLMTGILIFEAVLRLMNPTEVDGKTMFIVAVFGLGVNIVLLNVLGTHGHSHGGGSSHGHSHGGNDCGSHNHSHAHSEKSLEVATEHSHEGAQHVHESHSHASVASTQQPEAPCHHSNSQGRIQSSKDNHGHSHGNADSGQETNEHGHGNTNIGHETYDQNSGRQQHAGKSRNNGQESVEYNDSHRELDQFTNIACDSGLGSSVHGHDHGGVLTESQGHSHGEIEGALLRNPSGLANHTEEGGTIYRSCSFDTLSLPGRRGTQAPGGGASQNINVRAATLHVLGDLLQSIGVIIASAVIWWKPEWSVADPICTFIFALLVLLTTWGMLGDIVDVLMEKTPTGIDIEGVTMSLWSVPGVTGVHCLHVWALTSGKYLASVHVEAEEGLHEQVLKEVQKKLSLGLGPSIHSTIQVTSRTGCCD